MEEKTLRNALFYVTLFHALFSLSSAQSCDSYSFSNNNRYSNCRSLPVLNSFLHWTYDEASSTVDVAFRRPGTTAGSWIAWGLNPSGPQMLGTQALVAYAGAGNSSSGEFRAYTAPVTRLDTRLQEGPLSFQVSRVSASSVGNEAVIFARLQLSAELVSANMVWQVGPVSGGVPGSHTTSGDNVRSVGSVDFRSGQTSGGGGSGSRQRRRNTHGVLNAVSWGILMPMGVIMARYVKVFADPAWFYLHIAFQASGYVVGVAGWATGIKLGNDSPGIKHTKHRNLGITLFVLGTLQVFAMLLRPKPDHKYRLYWNIYHRGLGYATIIISIINIFEGFDILDPADKWKKSYIGIIIFLGAVALILEAATWLVVIRKKDGVSSKFTHGRTGNGHAANGSHGGTSAQQDV